MGACGNNPDPGCMVDFANSQTSVVGADRIMFYPQTFFMGKSATVICLPNRKVNVLRPLLDALAKHSGCPRISDVGPDVVIRSGSGQFNQSPVDESEINLTPPQILEVKALYRADFDAWKNKCHGEVGGYA
jgi:hypothetical protein